MSTTQRFFLSILPRSWAKSMEAESRAWLVECSCGCARSVWELGGIRWKAAGQPRRYVHCPQCGRSSWHTVTYHPATTSAAKPA